MSWYVGVVQSQGVANVWNIVQHFHHIPDDQESKSDQIWTSQLDSFRREYITVLSKEGFLLPNMHRQILGITVLPRGRAGTRPWLALDCITQFTTGDTR